MDEEAEVDMGYDSEVGSEGVTIVPKKYLELEAVRVEGFILRVEGVV